MSVRIGRLIAYFLVMVHGSTTMTAQKRASGLPRRMEAHTFINKWTIPNATFLSVESRQANHPDAAKDLARLRRRTVRALKQMSFPVVSDVQLAHFEMAMIVDPSVRYGTFHYQSAPYVYLLMRERPSGQLVYCALERGSYFRSASAELLARWKKEVRLPNMGPSGSLADCAAQAMRPVQEADAAHP